MNDNEQQHSPDSQNPQNPQEPPSPGGEQPPPASGATFDIHQVIAQAKAVLTNPAGFYQTMPRSGGFLEPVIFAAVMAAAGGVVAAVLSLFASNVGMLAAGFAGIVIFPIFAVIGGFIGAAVLFVIWKLMGSSQDYETAFRCWSAATALYPVAAVLSILPYLGVIVTVAWATYLMIEASVGVHERERRTSMIVFGVLGALLMISNVSSEYASRQLQDRMENFSRQFDDEDMTPEEAGRKMGEFLKGFEQGAKPAGGDSEN
ncbi:YIP1 family protein [Parahaliea mediterranea]|uniref:YIP1 family protein n=1 Tax=Parahaliea mediterranea TaxID=651086 RepID=UPI000E2F45C2|nr:YIP1 family protein [Parahaliea mediterranea]